jgi:hypothetical protein
MAVNLSALAGAGQQFFNDSGVILSGGKLYSYAAGTTTPQTTYTSASGSTAHTNPIILNSAGRVATGEIWLTAGSNYKFALYTSTDVLIATWDNITGINGTGITTNASSVQYDPAGTGAVATTVQAKLRESLSVLDFGADNTGVTNSTTAFTNAIAQCIITKQTLFIPAGTYKASIIIPPNSTNFSITGENWDSTIIEAVDGTQHGINIQAVSFYVTISNLVVRNTLALNDGNHCGILSAGTGANSGSSGLRLEKVKVSGYNFNIKIEEFNNAYLNTVWASGAVVDGTVAKSGSNIYVGHPTIHCVGIYMTNLTVSGGKYGIYGETCEGLMLSNSEIGSATNQAFIHQISGTGVTGMLISNCYFDYTGQDAMYLEGVNNGQFTNIWLSASRPAGTGRGLYLVDCVNNIFTNVQAFNCLGGGFILLQNSHDNQFSSCIIKDSTGYGIFIPNSSNYKNSFNNCIISDSTIQDIYWLDATVLVPNYLQNSLATTITVQTKDIVSGGSTNGGKTLSLPYFKQNIADGFSAGDAFFVPNTDQTIFYSPYNGSLIAISLALNDTRTAGTLYLRPLINGTADDDLRVAIDATNTQYVSLIAPVGKVPVTAGQRIGIYYDTDASWNTTGGAGTVDASVVLVFQTQ